MKSLEIAIFLEKEMVGDNIEVSTFSSLSNLQDNSVVFAKKYSKDYADALSKAQKVLAIVCEDYRDKITVPHIISPNPRLDYLRVISEFFVEKVIPAGIHSSATIEEGANIGKNVSIGAHCYIGPKVTIGDNTSILPNTSIFGKVTIGMGCYIKPGVVIGGPGFGFEYDENNIPIHFPHTGEVIIGDNVYIGANSTVDRAAIDATIIEDNVKIDNLVHVAHNCIIRRNTLLTAGTILSGGVIIGEKSWLSPNSTVHQKVKIGNNCTIGMGAVVLRKVKDETTVFGNPAYKVEM